jgi:uncharacterized protein (DUF2235 family)
MAKNIILLSDGTGDSAAKEFKTNVWRLYQAVDIGAPPPNEPAQLVFYDDGVGTETFKPLALMGLAFGIGLARNVKDLYTFLCRTYEPGDSIFLFGFSRGAFTVRILAGLILRCGLVTAPSESELVERVKTAYAEYKRDMARRATLTRPWLVAGRLLGGHGRAYGADHIAFNFLQHFPRIRFIGVWDTVDAYGMPVDELKEGIDRYIWPMTLADRRLSPDIERARHALSLDEERPTFRPVLWDERGIVDPDQVIQLWFAGVHANVGGGYPDDGLAHVAMEWMVREAELAGLRLDSADRMAIGHQVNAHGKQYDSRSGLAGYYRYGPRSVDDLCDDPEHGVSVTRPKIHGSVRDRITRRQVAYDPISFPVTPYDVLDGAPLETPADVDGRRHDMEAVQDAVLCRRVAYLATVGFTVVLVVLPLVDALGGSTDWPSPSDRIPLWGWVMDRLSASLSWVVAQQVLPAWVSFWVRSFARHPTVFVVSAAGVLWLFFRKSYELQARVRARAEYAWRRV